MKGAPATGFPAASRAVALKARELPFSIATDPGSTSTEVIGLDGRGEPPPPPPPPQEMVRERRKRGVSFKRRNNRTFITY